jgi:uncharacterized protein YraI
VNRGFAALSAGLLLCGASALAAPAAVASPAPRAAAVDCSGGPAGGWQAIENVLVRTGPGTNYASVGQVNKGQTVPACGALVDGGSYTACNSTMKVWAPVKFGGQKRYVVRACIG